MQDQMTEMAKVAESSEGRREALTAAQAELQARLDEAEKEKQASLKDKKCCFTPLRPPKRDLPLTDDPITSPWQALIKAERAALARVEQAQIELDASLSSERAAISALQVVPPIRSSPPHSLTDLATSSYRPQGPS